MTEFPDSGDNDDEVSVRVHTGSKRQIISDEEDTYSAELPGMSCSKSKIHVESPLPLKRPKVEKNERKINKD